MRRWDSLRPLAGRSYASVGLLANGVRVGARVLLTIILWSMAAVGMCVVLVMLAWMLGV